MSEFLTSSASESVGRVLVIHSWWGLTDSFRDYARRLAERGFVVGLADLYNGTIAGSAEEAKRLRSAPRREPMYKSLIRDLEKLRALTASDSPLAVVGFSMGGHWAIWLSQQPDLRLGAVVLYYAARGGNFSQSRASYQAHFADNDEWVKATARSRMERQIRSAACPYRSYEYPGTGHWFAETARPRDYDKAAADLAFERTVAHLADTTSTRRARGSQ